MSSEEENKSLVRRWLTEFWGEGRYAVADEICAPDYTVHDPYEPDAPPGPEGIKEYAGHFHQAFPGLRITIEDLVAEGDRVAARWRAEGTHTGALGPIAPSGKHVTVQGADTYRIADGRLAEAWTLYDHFGMLQQVGAIPAPGGHSG